MDGISIFRLALGIVIVVGILTTFWAFNSAVNESLDAANSLDIKAWGDSLIKLLLTGITLTFAGVIGEIITFFASPSRDRGRF